MHPKETWLERSNDSLLWVKDTGPIPGSSNCASHVCLCIDKTSPGRSCSSIVGRFPGTRTTRTGWGAVTRTKREVEGRNLHRRVDDWPPSQRSRSPRTKYPPGTGRADQTGGRCAVVGGHITKSCGAVELTGTSSDERCSWDIPGPFYQGLLAGDP